MDNNSTIHTSSEYTLNTCGEPVYNVLPCDTECMCSPQSLCKKPIVCTDRVYDKELEKWQNEINQENGGSGSGTGGGTGGSGEGALYLQLFTDVGNILTNTTQCTITAEVWDGRKKIENIPSYYFNWKRISSNKYRDDEEWNRAHLHYGNVLYVPLHEVQKQTLYQCEFNFEEYFKNN